MTRESKTNKISLKELIRRFKLLYFFVLFCFQFSSLQVQNGNSTALLVLLSSITCIICALNLALNLSSHVSLENSAHIFNNENVESKQFELYLESDEGVRCQASAKNLMPNSLRDEDFFRTRKLSYLAIPVHDLVVNNEISRERYKALAKIRYTLRKLEISLNNGWNSSLSTKGILPLGDFDYVRRDLPVYKLGYEKLRIKVQKRPKGGLLFIKSPFDNSDVRIPDKYLLTENYAAIMCLSFNTDHCINEENFKFIPLNKKVNRIKSLREILWSKDKFCKTSTMALSGLQTERITKYLYSIDKDVNDFQFTFPCWIMPNNYKALLSYAKINSQTKFISKPRSLGAGKGIYVVSSLSEVKKEKRTSNLLQTYMDTPHLIVKEDKKGYKWDMRTYVLVTSVTPFRGYVYKRGLVRIATSPYNKNDKCSGEGNQTGCLTNTSINKKVEGAKLKDITWSFHKLKKYVGASAFNVMFRKMKKVIGLTLLSSEEPFHKIYEEDSDTYTCQNCYQLLGVDIMFDENLEPKVVEVNGEPSLKTTNFGKTHYDVTKKNMARDLVQLVYNTKSALTEDDDDLALLLLKWGNCAKLHNQNSDDDKDIKPYIGKDNLEYVLNMIRERKDLGDFSPIYPTKETDLAEIFTAFLHIQEMKKIHAEDVTGFDTNRRLLLDKIARALLQPNVFELN